MLRPQRSFAPGSGMTSRACTLCSGPKLCFRVARIAHPVVLHCADEGLLETFPHGRHNDEPLPCDAALATIDHARRSTNLGGMVDVGVFQHQVRVGAARLYSIGPLSGRIPSSPEVVPTLVRLEEIADVTDGSPECIDCSGLGFAQVRFDL